MGRLIRAMGAPQATAGMPAPGLTPRRIAAPALMLALTLGLLTGTSLVQHNASGGASAAERLAALPQTVPDPAALSFASQNLPTDSRFQAYYTAHAGATTLGPALTPALPQVGGWLQVFTDGALFMPGTSPARMPLHPPEAREAAAALARLVAAGTIDAATGVVSLPLLQALMAAGSQVTIGGADSGLTYVDLRRAVLVANPPRTGGRRGAGSVMMGIGMAPSLSAAPSTPPVHFVAPIFHNALINPAFAPDGWRQDFGSALTGVLSATAGSAGQRMIVSVQVFQRQALLSTRPLGPASMNAPSATVTRLPLGLDYLRTFGAPAIPLEHAVSAWSTAATALLAQPGVDSSAVAHIGPAFPLTLTSDTSWVNGILWYAATWRGAAAVAWLPAGALTLSNPGGGPASAAIDALDSSLAAYLAGLGDRVGVVVDDVSRGITYDYNGAGAFTVASSVKVPIMLALLTQLEAQQRAPNDNEMSLLTTMIENSNNDSAQALYEEIGDAPGLTAFMQSVGISGLSAASGAWGWSTITPAAMVQLLARLQGGMILTPADRALALNLMEHIESDERVGVGTMAPTGATVALKDGWVNEPDGLWAMNSSGIVTVGGETYIIAVYTGQGATLDDGWAITEHVCDAVARALV